MFKPKYTITHPILNNFLDIAEVRSLVLHTLILPREEARLRREALVRMIHSSTSIEGNILNRYEVEKVLAGKKVDAPKRDVFEVKNYRDALHYVFQFIQKKKPITIQTILEIHRLVTKNTLTQDKCGKFRKDKVYVVSRRGSKIIKVSYTGPDAKQVPKLIKDLVVWLKKTKQDNICPIIVAGLAHSEIAAIHPFADGNGRTARILATLILYQRGYDFRKLFALEDYYNQDRPAYYKAIHLGKNYQERLQADSTNWLEYFISGFNFEMRKIKDKIIPLSLDVKMRKKLGGPVYLDKKQIKIVDFMMTMGRIDSNDVVDIFNIDKRTAQRYINEILKTKLIRKEGQGPASFYTLNI
ncbi:Fic family protein [Patescibacteria group bacterium]|nr:Fic family protein [Patescibacteria group bacterium]MBU4511986.1 Fic family protein [Patescibacteria group bacterium]MCG2693390.1 Fic family protein [Candidatus Parcubacteria bacterium]